METTPEQFWNDKHQTYAKKKFVTKPNWLATTLVDNLEKPVRILDLGCGHGQDSRYFAQNGHTVVSADFSSYVLDRFNAEARSLGIRQVLLELGEPPYPFADDEFDVVYAHLSLHYFPRTTTKAIFSDVARLLSPGGQFWALFNSEHDPECSDKSAVNLEERYLELSPGDRKRYFTVDELPELLGSGLVIELARYGHGTRKSSKDEYVELAARAAQREAE